MKSAFAQYVIEDLLAHLPGISAKAMFGGFGIYQDGKIFAIIAEDKLYFKVGEGNKSDYEALGSSPFTYYKGSQPYEMSYWELPTEIMEDRDQSELWVAKALAQHKN